jgi:hypothetical protein
VGLPSSDVNLTASEKQNCTGNTEWLPLRHWGWGQRAQKWEGTLLLQGTERQLLQLGKKECRREVAIVWGPVMSWEVLKQDLNEVSLAWSPKLLTCVCFQIQMSSLRGGEMWTTAWMSLRVTHLPCLKYNLSPPIRYKTPPRCPCPSPLPNRENRLPFRGH